jgi:asparagine synthase (glutamine-hydrolysing)
MQYKEHGINLCGMLDGMFSFVLLDQSVTPSRLIAARDPIGITTLYQGWHSSAPETLFFASELKALHEECDNIISFPPGHVYDSKTKQTTRYFNPSWWNSDVESPKPSGEADLKLVRETLEMAVRKRLMSEVPYGVLLSGGLDSSLIASIAARETDKLAAEQEKARHVRQAAIAAGEDVRKYLINVHPRIANDPAEDHTLASWPQLHSFAVGLPGSPDLLAARKAADFLGTIHHEYTFTVQEGLDAIEDVIYHLETYDVTTVRASTPMYLLSRKIKAMGVKMVLSGEGSDEIFGGYLYFHAAPSAADFHDECVKRVKNLHTADCLRANKSTMAWGLEARVPFLDKQFLEVAMNIDAKHKMFAKGDREQKDADGKPRMEKVSASRGSGADGSTSSAKRSTARLTARPTCPTASFGVRRSSSRTASVTLGSMGKLSPGADVLTGRRMKDHAAATVSDEKFAARADRWSLDTPDTKEAYWIREVFESHFPTEAAAKTAVRWIPKQEWGVASDPSGRAVSIHTAAYESK